LYFSIELCTFVHGTTIRTIRRTMGHIEALIPRTRQTSRWPRPSTPGDTRRTQWYSLGTSIRRTMVRHAGPIPAIPDVSPSFSGVDQNRIDPPSVRVTRQGSLGSRRIRTFRVLHRRQPLRLVGDRAYDSDKLDLELQKVRIEMISPHKDNRVRPATQDGRPLRRYRNRSKISRMFAWLQNYRRILVRYDRHSDNFLSFIHIGCMKIMLLRYF